MVENSSLDLAGASGLRTFEDLRRVGERGQAILDSLAESSHSAAFALGAEGKRMQARMNELGAASKTFRSLGDDGERMSAFCERMDSVLKRFK